MFTEVDGKYLYWSIPLFWDVWEVISESGKCKWELSISLSLWSPTKLFTELCTMGKESFSKCHPMCDTDRKLDSQLVQHVF